MGIFDIFFKSKKKPVAPDTDQPPEKAKHTEAPKPSTHPVADKANKSAVMQPIKPSTEPEIRKLNPALRTIKCISPYPMMNGPHHLLHAEKISFRHEAHVNIFSDVLIDSEKEVQLSPQEITTALSYNGLKFGYIDSPYFSKVITDLTREQIPFTAYILANGNEILFRVYEDRRIGHESDDQTVCKLTACTAVDKQIAISSLCIGEELTIPRNYWSDSIEVYYQDEVIGKLTKKDAETFSWKKDHWAFLEDVQTNKSDKLIPSIRIYSREPNAPNSATMSKGTEILNQMIVRRTTIKPEDERTIMKLNRYAVIDVETTGFSATFDKIIEIGIVIVDNGEIKTFSSYINPKVPIPKNITNLTGITDQDVADAPVYNEIAPIVHSLINGLPLIAHNATFDIGFLEALFKDSLVGIELQFLDTLSLARRNIKDVPNHKLGTLAGYFGITQKSAHRAGDDAYTTMQVFEAIKKLLSERISREAAAKKAEKEQLKATRLRLYGASPVFDVNFVFTGEFDNDRNILESHVQEVGGNLRNEVNTKTAYLVVGKIDNLPDWARERKLGKAENLIADGKKITLISESEYLELIRQAKAALSNN